MGTSSVVSETGSVCIYCRQHSADTKGQEHVYPEALGKHDLKLPLGAVCDACNAYFSDLDSALIAHNHIWPVIQLLGLPGKQGKPRRKLGSMHRSPDSGIISLQANQRQITKIQFDSKGVHVEVKDPPEFNDLKFRRALHRLAFNVVAYEKSPAHVLQECFDPVRKYIRSPRRGEAWPYAQVIVKRTTKRSELENRLLFSMMPDAPGMYVRLSIFVDDFYVDLLATGKLHEWARANLPDGTGLL